MMRQSSNRIQRSKKIKIKYALQLIVLLAISIWLLYQLKHTFDKKRSISVKTHELEKKPNLDEVKLQEKPANLGRKDLVENVNGEDRNGDNEIDEEDEEEKDRELEQLLEGNGEEEYSGNGEEDEEVELDDKDGTAIIKQNSNYSNKNESNDSNSNGLVSNQSLSLNSSIKQENYNESNGTVYLLNKVESVQLKDGAKEE